MADYSRPISDEEFNIRQEQLRSLDNGFKYKGSGSTLVCLRCGGLVHHDYWRAHFGCCPAVTPRFA